jgi:predicted RNA binding protein YcfA (HicA-like mRNA interferase family)
MAQVEKDRKRVVSRLESEGWELKRNGAKHDLYENAGKPGDVITVPRHKTLSPGVARSIAKAAGW